MNRKVALVCTGGTIGSSERSGIIDTDVSARETLINRFAERRGYSFSTFAPVNELSENMSAEALEKIADCVRAAIAGGSDAIIITHGTDTLTFTANLFSQLLADAPVPVIFVSADKPLDEGGNGYDNFAAALNFAAEKIRGVFVAYKNPGESVKIHLASRLVESEQLTGYVSSLASCEFGQIRDGRFLWNDSPLNPALSDLVRNPFKVLPGERVSTEVVSLVGRSLTDFRYLNFDKQPPKALVYKLYHSGTACTAAGRYDAAKFLERLGKAGIETVVAPVCDLLTPYSGADRIYSAAKYVAKNVSFELSVVKTMLAVGSGKNVGELLNENRAFEKLIEYR